MPAQKRPFDVQDEDPPLSPPLQLSNNTNHREEESVDDDDEDGRSDSDNRSFSSSCDEKPEFLTVTLSEIRKEVQCPICLGIIRKTRTVMECLHRFCRVCIDKSMRMGNNECPACRTHCASRRSLRDDPNFDAIISLLYPDIDKYEEEELAFHEEEKARNKQIQASIAQTFIRQTEALAKKKMTAKATAAFMKRSQGRRGRRRRNQATELQLSDDDDDEEEQENGNPGGKDSPSSADERCTEVKPKRFRRRGEGGGDENDVEVNRGTPGPSIGFAGKSERFSWGKGGMRSHTRYNNTGGGNSKNARSSRLSKLVDSLRNLEEIDDEFDIQIKVVSLDEQRMPNLEQPYLSCNPFLSVKHMCQYVALKTQFITGEVEILMINELNSNIDSSISINASASNSTGVADACKYAMRTLEAQETMGDLQNMCNSSKTPLGLRGPIKVGVDVSGMALSLKKRKLQCSAERPVNEYVESCSGVASTAPSKSSWKTPVGSEGALPEVEMHRRVTKRKNTSVLQTVVAMNPNIPAPPAIVVAPSEVVKVPQVDPVVGQTFTPASFDVIEQPSETERRLKFDALMEEHRVEPANYRASAAELENAPIWHPCFGKDADTVFSTESTLFCDEHAALDFVKGVGTPRDVRLLEKKDEQSRHRSAQYYMLKALMLASRNDYFVESSSKQISQLQMVLGQKVAQVKNLTVQLDDERKKRMTNDSALKKLTAQVKDIEDGWSEMKVQLAESQKELAAFDHAFAAKGKLVDDLTKQVADLQAENEASEAAQGELQGRPGGAAGHYQALMDAEVSSYYAKGLEEGYHNGLETQPSAGSGERLTEVDADFTVDPVVDVAGESGPALKLFEGAGDGNEDPIAIGQLPVVQCGVSHAIPAPGNVGDPVIISDDAVDKQTVADETSIQEAIHASPVIFAVPTELTSSADDQASAKN